MLRDGAVWSRRFGNKEFGIWPVILLTIRRLRAALR